MKKTLLLIGLISMLSCNSSKQHLNSNISKSNTLISKVSNNKSYGLSPKHAVKVGGVDKGHGPQNERRFLEALAGPKGEAIQYYRAGSCCPVKSKNGFNGYAMLDNYKVYYNGCKDTISIYINMYDYGKLKAPSGFTIKK